MNEPRFDVVAGGSAPSPEQELKQPRVACAGGIVYDDNFRLLLIRRGKPPAEGRWSLPGGRCLPGESAANACVREVREETGLKVKVVRPAGRVSREGPGVIYDIEDFICTLVGGAAHAGDDASDVRWASRTEMRHLDLAPGLLEALDEWDALPD